MRLTPEVVQRSRSHMNPLKERELELRGLQIPLIENLASHQGTYDTLNLTDNSITLLGNIPLSPRIRTIHIASNNVSSVANNFPTSVPYLESLSEPSGLAFKKRSSMLMAASCYAMLLTRDTALTSNSLPSLSSLLPLANCKNLVSLSLVGNPVQSEKYYREWVIWKIGSATRLRILDFRRIKESERTRAKELFEDSETGLPNKLALGLTTDAATDAANARAKETLAKRGQNLDGAMAGRGKGRLLNAEEKEKVRQAILKAKNFEEIKRLERMLNEGRVPAGEASGVEGVGDVEQAEVDME